MAVIAALNWMVIVVAGVLETTALIPENGMFQAITGVVALLSMVLAYGLVGLTSALTGTYRRAISGLLLLEAVTFVAMIANSVATLGTPVIVFELGHLVVYVGLGVLHRGSGHPTGATDSTTDPSV